MGTTTDFGKPGTKAAILREAVNDLLIKHAVLGELPTTIRFLYYELKQAGVDTGKHASRRADQDVIDAVTWLREQDYVDWDDILDETRDVQHAPTAKTVADGVVANLDAFRIDTWDQKPLIICESRGVRSVLRATADHYRAVLTSTNGQCAGHLRVKVSPLIGAGSDVLYFGDHNPAGSDIERNTQRVLEEEVGYLRWRRLAITPEQAEAADLPPKPGTDNRRSNGGAHVSYECEALGQGALVSLLTDELDDLLPEPLADVQEREERERSDLRTRLGL